MDTDKRQLINQIDEMIGGSRADDLRNSSTLRVQFSEEGHRGQRLEKPSMHLHFNLKLGKIEDWGNESQAWVKERWQHWREHHTPRPYKSELNSTTPINHSDNPQPKSAGVTHISAKQEFQKIEKTWHISLQKHISFTKKSEFWVHLRARRDFSTQHVLYSLATEIGGSMRKEWEYNMHLDSRLPLSADWVFNFTNSGFWLFSEEQLSSRHGPSLTYLINKKQTLAFSASVNMSDIGHGYNAESYNTGVSYRVAAWKNFFYISLNPYIEYARVKDFHSNPGISFTAEAVF